MEKAGRVRDDTPQNEGLGGVAVGTRSISRSGGTISEHPKKA